MQPFRILLADALGDDCIADDDKPIDRPTALRVRVFATGLLAWIAYQEARKLPAGGNRRKEAESRFQTAISQLDPDDAQLLKELRSTLLDYLADDDPANGATAISAFLTALEFRARNAIAPETKERKAS